MRVAFLLFLFCLSAAGYSQPPAGDQLLWYKGKKLRPNVLLTVSGDTIFFTPAKGQVKRVPKKTSANSVDKMALELKRTPERINETIQKFSSRLPQPALPEISMRLKAAYKDVDETFSFARSQTLVLPDPQLPPAAAQGKGPHMETFQDNLLERIKKAVAELRDYVRAHENEKINSVPVPPSQQFDYCAPCDQSFNNNYAQQMEKFFEELGGEDRRMLQQALGLAREAQIHLAEKDAAPIQADINGVISFLMKRAHEKAQLLLDKYGDDPSKITAVVQAVLSTERNSLLFGLQLPSMANEALLKLRNTMAALLNRAIEEKDYPVALNLPLLFMVERQCQLMGSSLPDDLFNRFLRFNQFKLNLHITGKIRGEEMTGLAELKGDNWLMAVPDTNCRLQWIVSGPSINKMPVDLIAAEVKVPGESPVYVGTKKWFTRLPKMRMEFCSKTGTDTVEIYQFFPEGLKEMWKVPQLGVMEHQLTYSFLVQTFLDEERLKRDAAKYQDPAEIEKLQKEIMAEYENMMKNGNPGQMNPQNMAQYAEMQKITRRVMEKINEVNVARYLFQPDVKNKSGVIVQDKINGKELFPENTSTEYAWFHLTITHDPDGPHGYR